MSAAQDPAAVEAVRRAVALYAFRLDDRDYEGLVEMLHEDCSLFMTGFSQHGREQMLASVSGMQSAVPGRHLVGPTIVEIEGTDQASAWTDMVGIVPGTEGTHVVAGTWRYHDRLVLEDGRWVFTHRYLHAPAESLIEGAPPLPTV
jgi:hypothetical protein